MKNKIFYFFTFILLATLTGCEENVEPVDIEFITFQEASKSFVIDEGTTLTAEFKIYTAKKVSSDTNLSLSAIGTFDASNYSVPASVTMLANSNEATISVSITENNLDKINGETLSITIASPDGYYAGATTMDITINVFCPSTIEGSYSYSDGNQKDVTVTIGAGVNNFVVSGDNAFGTNYPFNINDQCGSIVVTGSFLEDTYDIPASGTGNVMADGSIVLTYTVDGYFENRTMTLVKK
jgi:hypothetical protein